MSSNLMVCETCQFKVEQIDLQGKQENMCILTNKNIGLFNVCNKFKKKTGEHFSN